MAAIAALVLTAAAWLPLLWGMQQIDYDKTPVQPSQPTTYQGPFVCVARLSGCNAEPAVGDRTYAELDALADTDCAIWEVPMGAQFGQFRFQIDEDAKTATVQAWTAASRYDPGTGSDRDEMDDFTLGWSFAPVGGQQTGPNSNVWCDTLVTTSYWPAVGVTSDSGNNRIARYDVDLRGVKYVAWLRTDADASLTVYVDARIY